MKNKILLALLFVVALGLILIVYLLNKSSSKNLELVYKTNGGVPYEWTYTIEDESVVEFVKSYTKEDKNKNGMVGAPITTAYVFKGLKEGETTITFRYVNITDGTIDKEEINNITVDKNKNIKVESK